jgi:hypothetical protein
MGCVVARTGESEFGGEAGMVQPRNIRSGNLTGVEETWAVYATDPESAMPPDATRVGYPASYARSAPARGGVYDEREIAAGIVPPEVLLPGSDF